MGTFILPYSGFLSREKNFANFAFCGNSRKFSPRKSIFKQLDTALVGVVYWVTANSRKVFSAKIYFQAIRYRASGRGALGYCKFAKSFLRENLFSSNSRKFSPAKETRYTVCAYRKCLTLKCIYGTYIYIYIYNYICI